MYRVEAMTKKLAPAAGLRFVRRTLGAELSELALMTLEQTGQDLLALGASREPDAQTVRDGLWRGRSDPEQTRRGTPGSRL